MSQCIAPLGMESGAISDEDISASTSFEHASVGPHNARIRIDKNGGAWCPKNMIGKDATEWIEIDLHEVKIVTATETMGRFGNGQGAEFAESYVLEYFRPRLAKWVRYRDMESQQELEGNANTYLAVKNTLAPLILASKIRFHPYSAHQRTICMRVEVYGCSWDDGVLSYSMPQGDKRGTSYEFYDWNYDGEWKGDMLINGLGSLTDGNLGPEDYKLSYYAKNRGWVGWKNDRRETVEIMFEFDQVREFHSIHIYSNNQFTKDTGVFKEAKMFFSIGGKVFNSDPVSYLPMEDAIFEEPRNVSAKLHRRIGRYVKLELHFAAKWILISEVSFDSTPARGNYSEEREIDTRAGQVNDIQQDSQASHVEVRKSLVNSVDNMGSELEPVERDDSPYMPIIVGVLTTVILLLAAIIFFIVSRTRQKKWFGVHKGDCSLPAEKIALNSNDGLQFPYDPFISGPGSDSGSNSNGSRGTTARGKMPLLDDNYNAPHSVFGSPRSPRCGVAYNVSREGSVGSRRASPALRRATPQLTPRNVGTMGNTAQRRIISSPFQEPPLYMEPYHVMRYSPYLRCGPPSQDLLAKEPGLLSDTSCGDYAIPMPRQNTLSITKNTGGSIKFSGSVSSLEQNSDYVFLQANKDREAEYLTDSLRAMKARIESSTLTMVSSNQINHRQQLSDGAFGTVFVADVNGVPGYGGKGDKGKKLAAVKYMSLEVSDQERNEFTKEVRLLSGLEDENISRVLGVCVREDPFFVVMEYLEHGDLTQFLRCHLPEDTQLLPPGTKTLSFGTLIYMATQIASGMKYLESLNFVHRDIATRNCLVGKAYHIKICDFGSDSPIYRRDYYEMENHLLIPIRWMAWESVMECRYTTKSDVWSFAVCLWEILNYASVRPHQDLTDDQVLANLEAGQQGKGVMTLQAPRQCPKDLYELMCECWKTNELQRPSFREIHLFLQRKNLGFCPL